MATLAVSVDGEFLAFLNDADADAWETARVSTHVLRYRDDQHLDGDDLITVGTQTYKVIGQPKRINSEEYQANLVKQ